MEDKKKNRFYRVGFHYFIRYLIVCLLVFLSSVVIYLVSKNIIKDYIIRQTQTRIQEGLRELDQKVEQMNIVAGIINQNSSFSQLVYFRQPDTRDIAIQLKDILKITRQMNYIQNDQPYLFIIFKHNNLFISSYRCSHALDSYYSKFMRMNMPDHSLDSAEDFKQAVFRMPFNEFSRIADIEYVDDIRKQRLSDALLYVATGIQSLAVSDPNYRLCFAISKESIIQKVFLPDLEQEGYVKITESKNGQVLLDYHPVTNNGNYLVIKEKQGSLNWSVEVGITESYISRQMQPAKNLLQKGLVLGLLIAIVLVIYCSNSRFRNFYHILNSLSDEDISIPEPIQKSGEEIIISNIKRMEDHKKALSMQIQELKKTNRAIMTENLITKGIHNEEEEKLLLEVFQNEPEFYCVVNIQFLELKNNAPYEQMVIDIKDALSDRAVTVVNNVRSNYMNEILVIELLPAQEADLSNIKSCFADVMEDVSQKYGLHMHIGVSAVATGLTSMQKCYEQARRITQALYIYEGKNMVQAYSMYDNPANGHLVTIEFLSSLQTMLSCGQGDLVKEKLRTLASHYTRMNYLYEEQKEQIFYSIQNVFYSVALQLKCGQPANNIPQYSDTRTCLHTFEQFEKCANWIQEEIEAKKKSKNAILKADIIQCIEECYSDSTLSAYIISQKVGISEKYLFQFWKAHMGESLSSYILNMRIDNAKKFLQNTDYSNEKIAEICGFGSVNTFYRNFSKVTGISPKLFRENTEK